MDRATPLPEAVHENGLNALLSGVAVCVDSDGVRVTRR
jgi:hypothetical protein